MGEDIRATEKDRVELYQCLRTNDITKYIYQRIPKSALSFARNTETFKNPPVKEAVEVIIDLLKK